MKGLTTTATLVLASVLAAGAVSAQNTQSTSQMKEEKPGLLAQATITPDAARKLALAQVANGQIAEQEIEMEDGKLAYSFDIKVPGRRGIEEVLIDAKTGALIAHEHESPKQEAAERAKEAREGRKEKGERGERKDHDEKTERPSR
ncbi:MAG: PepSY domain-containing protein [Gemmatimonadaceae bacterium]|nr:PepSY domain-containing protein [Gemmatimonadaceae bacterium]